MKKVGQFLVAVCFCLFSVVSQASGSAQDVLGLACVDTESNKVYSVAIQTEKNLAIVMNISDQTEPELLQPIEFSYQANEDDSYSFVKVDIGKVWICGIDEEAHALPSFSFGN